MSGNLNYSKSLKRHAFFTVRERAWHNLGVVLHDHPTAEEAIIHAGLDFEVAKTPVRFDNLETLAEMPDDYVTYRTDTGDGLGIVGKVFEPIQNKDAFKFFDIVVGDGEAQYETAGALGRGETVFITAKLPQHIVVRNHDVVDQYLFLTNYHGGDRHSLVAAFTPIRVVCENTLNAALRRNSLKIRIRHTKNFKQAMEEAKRVMATANQLAEELTDVYDLMAKQKVTDSELRDMVLNSIATRGQLNAMEKDEKLAAQIIRSVDAVLEYAGTAEDQQMFTTKGTAWGAYNALTGYYQNQKKWRSAKTQFISTMEGDVARNVQKMFNLCLDMLN